MAVRHSALGTRQLVEALAQGLTLPCRWGVVPRLAAALFAELGSLLRAGGGLVLSVSWLELDGEDQLHDLLSGARRLARREPAAGALEARY